MAHVNHGRFVWHDLMSKSPEADLAFLKALIGYTVNDRDMGDMGNYPMLMVGEAGVGGVVGMEAEQPQPSHWIGYVAVSDLDTTLTALVAAGGTIHIPAFPVSDVGRIAIVSDPNGAVFSPMEPATAEDMSSGPPRAQGHFCWWELVTSDPAGAQAFYSKVLGWGCHEIDMGGRPYWLWTQGADAMNPGGMMRHSEGLSDPAFWLMYVLVDDVDAATERVADLGGAVMATPMDVPGQGRMSVITTPSGAAMALFKSASN